MYVIAGASGKTGRVVAATLLDRGEPVRVVVRDAAKADELADRGAEVAVASLDDAGALGSALRGASGFFALVPEDPAIADFHGHRRRMVDAMAAVVRSSEVPHVVLLSAAAAVLPDGNGPAADLHHAERALRDAAPAVTVVRASYFQDNVLGAVPAARDGVYPNFFPSADLALPTVATPDVGRLAARLLAESEPRGGTIDLVGPAYSARDMAASLGRAMGRQLRVVDVPAEAQRDALIRAGLPEAFAEALAEMFACFASGRVTPGGDRLERGTTTLDEVLRDGLAR